MQEQPNQDDLSGRSAFNEAVDTPHGPDVSAVSGQYRAGRGKIIQLLVFVNGLILSVTSFLTLNVFMEQMRNDYSQTLTNNAVSASKDMVRYLVRDMRVLSEMVRVKNQALVSKNLNLDLLLSNIDSYDRIIVFQHQEGRQWSARDLYRHEERLKEYDTKLSNSAQSLAPILIPLINSKDNIAFKTINDAAYQGFVAVKGLWLEGELKSVQAIFVNMKHYYAHKPSFDLNKIPSLTLSQANAVLPLYSYGQDDMMMPAISQPIIQGKKFGIAGKNLSLDLVIKEDFRILFLSKIPYLIMLFGMTLTMIGTLYVRNNQKQSLKLADAAASLKEKNTVMNRQVHETERLYRVLQKSEKEYRNVMDSISDILFELSDKGEIQFLNQSWESVTGIDKRQVMGERLFEFLDQHDQEELTHQVAELTRGLTKKIQAVTRLKTSDNQWRTVELSLTMMKDKNGEREEDKLVGTLKDIEDQTRANRALIEVEKRYQTIVENALGGIYQATIEGEIISANASLARILGYDSSDELMAVLTDISSIYLDRHDRQRYERELLKVGFIRNLETRVRRMDGAEIWVSESARAVKDADGNLEYFEGSIEDVTQRKQAEDALRDAKIQSDLSSRAKSEFLANMSHELRTPLNAIIGFSEIIKTEAMGPLGQPAYSEYAEEIYGSGQQLLNVINEILDISKIEAGERALNEGVVKLGQVTQSALNMLVSKIEARKLALINNLDDNMPAIVGEELSLKQILLNLISNAIKFTHEGGQVTLGYDYAGPGNDLMLSITDTGIGMDEADIPKAFSAFGQIDNALDRNISGTGLGLTLSQALIKMHGGRIEIVSQKGVGTTVTIMIPARRVSKKPTSSAMGDESRGNVRVLKPKSSS